MSPQRHIHRITAPVVLSCGTLETPEFRRHAKDFADALQSAAHPVELIIGANYFYQDMWETLGNPYGPNGRDALP